MALAVLRYPEEYWQWRLYVQHFENAIQKKRDENKQVSNDSPLNRVKKIDIS